ncbi:Dna polymerase kappa [Thalictrum thalictroides]|uniref:DNA-directed DNA polymerase n=1 Tax=Thalictrum thalictroides TaxID=46969 RepID=A0A7J6VI24_THATH|nr:Dna polymerase kappa [Thalictrum thalictroides]
MELEVTRDLSRTWLHVDMDAFYAAVETKENPSLIKKPMAVGGMSMVSTANYEVCSDINKPNGHFVLPNNRIAVMTFISSLPIRKIGGIGNSARPTLLKLGHPQVRSRKSKSSERTFSATGDEASLYHQIADIAESLSSDVQKEGLCGRTLTLKLKTASFEVRTRAVSLQKYIFSCEDILYHGSKLLQAELPVSLILIDTPLRIP